MICPNCGYDVTVHEAFNPPMCPVVRWTPPEMNLFCRSGHVSVTPPPTNGTTRET